MSKITLFDYWRSTASYRVRIALLLKGLEFQVVPVDLVRGEHRSTDHLARNPQGLVPAINIDGQVFTQSLAIIEYLDALHPEPRLVPADPVERARVQALAYAIAMEIHPVCNLRVANHVAGLTDGGDQAKIDWMQAFIRPGLVAFEAMLDDAAGPYCHGDAPTMADLCLIPQLYNANRWGVDYADLSHICAIETACKDIPAFARAYPDNFRPA